MSEKSGFKVFGRSIPPFALVLAIVFIPALLVVSTIAADRLGYCVNDILPGTVGLNVEPYVQDVRPDSAILTWRSTTNLAATLTWQGPDGEESTHDFAPAKMQAVRLAGLTPNALYTWQLAWGTRSASGTIRTAPGPTDTVRFGVIGDSGTASSAQYEIARQLRESEPAFVIHTGDVVYMRGALCHYGPKFFAPYGEMLANIPIYPTIGNHDLMAKNGSAYFESFVLPSATVEDGERYYSFDYGPVHVSVIDSEFYAAEDMAAVDRQRTWLATDLANTDLLKIVVLHRPPVSSTENKVRPDIFEDIAPILEQNGVELVLSGHAHNYERSIPINGVTYIVTGGGGAPLYSLTGNETSAVAQKVYHLILFEATPDGLTGTVIARDGVTLDTFAIENRP